MTVTITGPNNIPIALNDSAVTFEDQSVVVQVLSNDSDIDPQNLTVTHINGSPISVGTPVSVGVRGGTATLAVARPYSHDDVARRLGEPDEDIVTPVVREFLQGCLDL